MLFSFVGLVGRFLPALMDVSLAISEWLMTSEERFRSWLSYRAAVYFPLVLTGGVVILAARESIACIVVICGADCETLAGLDGSSTCNGLLIFELTDGA